MHLVRNVPVMAVDSDIVAELLCNQGIYAYVDEKSDTKIECTDRSPHPQPPGCFRKRD